MNSHQTVSKKLSMAEQLNERCLFPALPRDVREKHVYSFMPLHDLAALAQTSDAFNLELQTSSIWRQKLVDEQNCDAVTVNWLYLNNLITDWRRLYHALSRIGNAGRYERREQKWKFLCLSGEMTAVSYALNNKIIPESSVYPLLYAAINGTLEVIKALLNGLKLEPTSLDTDGVTMMHYAAAGGNATLMLQLAEQYNFKCHPERN